MPCPYEGEPRGAGSEEARWRGNPTVQRRRPTLKGRGWGTQRNEESGEIQRGTNRRKPFEAPFVAQGKQGKRVAAMEAGRDAGATKAGRSEESEEAGLRSPPLQRRSRGGKAAGRKAKTHPQTSRMGHPTEKNEDGGKPFEAPFVPQDEQGKPLVPRGLTLGLERSLGRSLVRALAKAWEREQAEEPGHRPIPVCPEQNCEKPRGVATKGRSGVRRYDGRIFPGDSRRDEREFCDLCEQRCPNLRAVRGPRGAD